MEYNLAKMCTNENPTVAEYDPVTDNAADSCANWITKFNKHEYYLRA
jgi:hypothetical protein